MSCQHLLGDMGPKLRRGAGLEGKNVETVMWESPMQMQAEDLGERDKGHVGAEGRHQLDIPGFPFFKAS